mgnify:CR=1 FL=1
MQSILLIGAGSSVGKTHLARILSERLGIQDISVDELRKQISDTNLHLLEGDETIWDFPVEELLSRLFQEGFALEAHLYSLINSWLAAKEINILEGEGIVPKVASQLMMTSKVNAIFLIETDDNRLFRTLYERSHAFQRLTEPRQRRIAKMNSAYGRWLHSEAEHYGLPWVSSQPWSSLPDRVLDFVHR